MAPTSKNAANKPGPKKSRKPANKPANKPTRRPALKPDQTTTSVLHGAMQDTIREAFLKRQ